jgi:DNA invertase Pin-like site-specific DNA recombinase
MKLRDKKESDFPEYALPFLPPAKASDYIRSLKELAELRPGIKVTLYLRESHRTQKKNFAGQEAYARRKVEARGIVVVKVFRDVSSGFAERRDWSVFLQAVAHAQEHGTILVAVSVPRFLRSRYYNSEHDFDAEPSADEFDELLLMADGVTLATIIHPSKPPWKVRKYESDYGRKAKGSGTGGRPKKAESGAKKQRLLDNIELVREMKSKGKKARFIAKRMGIPRSTVQDWLNGMKIGKY